MKTLPKELTINQLYLLAGEIVAVVGWSFAPFPSSVSDATLKFGKREAPGKLLAIVREIVGIEAFEQTLQSVETSRAVEIRLELVQVAEDMKVAGRKWLVDSDDPEVFQREIIPLSLKKVKLQRELDSLSNAEEIVYGKALELFGIEEAPRGLVDGDYHTHILVWGQQKAATLEKYGVEELILAPVNVLLAAGIRKEIKIEKHLLSASDTDLIAALASGENTWKLVAKLAPNGENSTFFKAISRKLLGKDTTDGVNQVRLYEGELYPVVS